MAVLLGAVLLVTCLASTEADFAVIAPHGITGTWRHSVTLPCTYSAVDHVPQRTVWLFNDRRLFERDDTGDHVFVTRYRDRLSLPQDRQGSNVSLTIVNLEIDDGGVYTCKVSLMSPGTSNLITKEASTHLYVRKVAVTIPVIHPEGSLFEVFEGTMLRFTCFAEGSPPITYRWYKRGMEGTSEYVQTSGPSFIIESAQSSHSGTYYCEVENKIPAKTTKKSQVFELNITGAGVSTTTNPQIRMGSTERMTTAERSQSTRYREPHGTSAPSSTKDKSGRQTSHSTEVPKMIISTTETAGKTERAQTTDITKRQTSAGNKRTSNEVVDVYIISSVDGGRRTHHSTKGPKTITRTIETAGKKGRTRTTDTPERQTAADNKAPTSTRGSGSSLLLIIMVIVLCLALLVILVGLLVTRCKRRKGTDGIYGIPTMSELNTRANQDVPIVNVCQVNINPINISENNSCPISDIPTLRRQNDYQLVMTSDDQKPGNDCQSPYANFENEYEKLLNER